jgi:predicted transcriptional regulator
VLKKAKDVRISDEELQLLEVINQLGPSSSQRVHEYLGQKFEYLFLIRCLHRLVEKGFLRRLIINKTQLYKTSRSYTYIKGYLSKSNTST